MLRNLSCFCCCLFFPQIIQKLFQEHYQGSDGFDLDPNCLQILSANDKSHRLQAKSLWQFDMGHIDLKVIAFSYLIHVIVNV